MSRCQSVETYPVTTKYYDGTVVGEVRHGDHIDIVAQTPGRHMIEMRVEGYTDLAYSYQTRTAAAADKAHLAALLS